MHFLGLLARLARLVLHRLGRDIYGSERGATLGGLWWGGLVVLVVLLLLAWHELGVLELLALARVELLIDLELLG